MTSCIVIRIIIEKTIMIDKTSLKSSSSEVCHRRKIWIHDSELGPIEAQGFNTILSMLYKIIMKMPSKLYKEKVGLSDSTPKFRKPLPIMCDILN